MTVNTLNITSGPYAGNGTNDTYSYTFRVEDKTQLSVYETDDLGVQTLLVVDTDYTVNAIGVDAGGTVVRTAGNLPTNYTWYIRSNYIENQLTAFSSQGGFFPDVHEAQMDHITFLIQQQLDKLDRAFSLSDAIDIDGTFTIADIAADRASKYLAFDASGNLVVVTNVVSGSVSITPFMETLLDDTTAAAGRATLIAAGLADNNAFSGDNTFSGNNVFNNTNTFSGVNTHTNPVINGIMTGTAIGRGALVYWNGVSPVIADSTDTVIDWDSESYDTDSIHDAVTNSERLTVPAGVTKIKLVAEVSWPTNSTGIRQIDVQKNGTTTFIGRPKIIASAASALTTVQNVVSPVLTVTAGDYFELYVHQTSGGNLTLGTGDGYHTWFSMEIIK